MQKTGKTDCRGTPGQEYMFILCVHFSCACASAIIFIILPVQRGICVFLITKVCVCVCAVLRDCCTKECKQQLLTPFEILWMSEG